MNPGAINLARAHAAAQITRHRGRLMRGRMVLLGIVVTGVCCIVAALQTLAMQSTVDTQRRLLEAERSSCRRFIRDSLRVDVAGLAATSARMERQVLWHRVLRAVGASLPEGYYVTEIRGTDTELRIKGIGDVIAGQSGLPRLDRFADALRRDPAIAASFTSVGVRSAEQYTAVGGAPGVEFEVVAGAGKRRAP